MSTYKGEQVLVVPREVFDSVGDFQGVSLEVDRYLSYFLQAERAQFLDREIAEDSPEYKQLIAYAIFRHDGKVLAYARTKKGGEARLHDKLSVGIGGHINPIDGIAESMETYLAGVEREIREEVNFDGASQQQLIALINDDSNEVGRVHLGVVHLFELSSPRVEPNELSLADMGFYSLEELNGEFYDRLESWSQIAVRALQAMDQ